MSQFAPRFQTQDGLELVTKSWMIDDPRAIVCLVHGLGEHSGRYEHVAQHLNQQGYSLVAFDTRGHGLSQGKRGHAPNYECLMSDVDLFLMEAKNASNAPIFLYGHSLGGHQVINFLLRTSLDRHPKLRGAVVTSPALRPAFTPPALKIAVGKIAYNLVPSLTLSNELNISDISRDQDVVDRYLNDELVHDRISARLGLDVLMTGEWAIEHASELVCPMLIMHGTADGMTSSEASLEFAEKAGATCEIKLWDGLFHETHNEPEKSQVLKHMTEWLNAQVASISID